MKTARSRQVGEIGKESRKVKRQHVTPTFKGRECRSLEEEVGRMVSASTTFSNNNTGKPAMLAMNAATFPPTLSTQKFFSQSYSKDPK